MRVALINFPYPETPDQAVERARVALQRAGEQGVRIACFPECYVPGYRGLGHAPPPPDAEWLDRAWQAIADAARRAQVAAIVGTERIVDGELRASAIVIGDRGERLGFQDKVQLDPSEDATYAPGTERHVFRAGELTFGIVICHEGWRYPETTRYAARRGARVVFHPHYHPAEPGSHRPTTFAEAANSFHEKAALCRAAENTVYFATVNYASPGSPTTSAFVRPDGTVLSYQPYGEAGMLVADLDLAAATGLLASRCRS